MVLYQNGRGEYMLSVALFWFIVTGTTWGRRQRVYSRCWGGIHRYLLIQLGSGSEELIRLEEPLERARTVPYGFFYRRGCGRRALPHARNADPPSDKEDIPLTVCILPGKVGENGLTQGAALIFQDSPITFRWCCENQSTNRRRLPHPPHHHRNRRYHHLPNRFRLVKER